MHKLPPSDAEIRPALKEKLLADHAGDADTVVLEELGVYRGEVRVDMAVVNGTIHGYEIKSDRDSLRRLRAQAELYGKCFNRSTLVVGDRHLDEALALLPDWWGVLRVGSALSGPCFSTVRRAGENPARNARVLAELLWLDDAMTLLERHGLDRGVRGKPRRIVWDRVCESLDLEVIADAVRAKLKTRAVPIARQ